MKIRLSELRRIVAEEVNEALGGATKYVVYSKLDNGPPVPGKSFGTPEAAQAECDKLNGLHTKLTSGQRGPYFVKEVQS
jgi:hypothetical protein